MVAVMKVLFHRDVHHSDDDVSGATILCFSVFPTARETYDVDELF